MATVPETPEEMSLRIDDYAKPIGPRDPSEHESPNSRYYFPFNRNNRRKNPSSAQALIKPRILT